MRRIDRLLKETTVRQRTAFHMREALTRYYLGLGTRGECLDDVSGCSETTYYRIRNEYPELVQAIDDSARLEALLRVSGEEIAFQGWQKRMSHVIQERATEALLDPRVMEAMLQIILGKSRTVVLDGTELPIIPYPRDQLEALRVVQDLARYGCLPESETVFKPMEEPDMSSEDVDDPSWLIGLNPGSDAEMASGWHPTVD